MRCACGKGSERHVKSSGNERVGLASEAFAFAFAWACVRGVLTHVQPGVGGREGGGGEEEVGERHHGCTAYAVAVQAAAGKHPGKPETREAEARGEKRGRVRRHKSWVRLARGHAALAQRGAPSVALT